MLARKIFVLSLAFALAGCSSVSDRYAFWRDHNEPNNTAREPNLADVPPAPNSDATINEMQQIRTRLEQDRENAVLTAQSGDTPYYHPAQQNDTMGYAPTSILNNSSQSTIIDQSYPSMFEMPAPQNQSWQSGNTVYMYGQQQNTNPDYVYGQSPVHIRSLPAYQHHDLVSNQVIQPDPSISIDLGVLGGGNKTDNSHHAVNHAALSFTTSGEPVVYYAHGSARLSKQDRQTLRRIANQAKETPNNVIVIGHASQETGHRNALTSRKVNLNMSVKRTLNVAEELVRMGVSPNKLRITAMGDSFSGVSPNQDRRVDILFD